MAVQLCFGLFASNKHPIDCPVTQVESRVAEIARHGTYADAAMETKVFDTYEVLTGKSVMRAFLDLDIKRWKDGWAISNLQGVVLAECLKGVLEKWVPRWEDYGRVLIGNSSGYKSKTEYCVSFRVWFPCVIGSSKAIEEFAGFLIDASLSDFQEAVPSEFRDMIEWDSFWDRSVYRNLGKLRLPGCTKQGEKHRPLLLDYSISSEGCVYTDCLITHLDDAICLRESDPVLESVGEDPELPTKSQVVPFAEKTQADGHFRLVVGLADLLQSHWDKNKSRFQLIAALWCFEASTRMRDFIHEQCAAKNPNNVPSEIDGQISRIVFEGVSVKTILKHALDTDPIGVLRIKSEFPTEWRVMFDTEDKDKGVIDEIMPIQSDATCWILDEYCEQYVRPYPISVYDTIVLKSHMGTGKTVALFEAIKGFDRILLLSARRSYSAFIQSELLSEDAGFVNYMNVRGNLSRYPKIILQMESLHRIDIEYEEYDLVIMDEVESLLFQMNSVGTHGLHHKENYEILHRVVAGAKKVLAMDAFVGMRTFTFFHHIRPAQKSIFVHNTFQPYNRRAMELCAVVGQRILPDFGGLVERLEAFVKQGKRCVFVCSSKTKGESVYSKLMADGVRVLFHSSEDSKEEKSMLLNIRKEWAKYQVVIYTTTITVGVSYSNVDEKDEFDELFLYATASCALPRDIAQALLRARVIKSNRLWFCIEERCVKSGPVGVEAIQNALVTRRNDVAQASTWAETPEWVLQLIAQNENEMAVSRRFFPLVLKRYLKLSGYTLEFGGIADEILEVEMADVGRPKFDAITMLNDTDAERIEELVIGGEASKEDRVMLLKHRIVGKFEDVKMAKEVWDTMFVVQEGKKGTLETKFWNIVHEKSRNLEEAWRTEAGSRYAEQAKRSLLKQECIRDLCKVLGIAHSCVEVSWTHEAFEGKAEAILANEEKMRKVMGVRTQREGKENNLHKAADFVSQIFEEWSGSVVTKSVSKKKENGKLVRKYELYLIPIIKGVWDNLK